MQTPRHVLLTAALCMQSKSRAHPRLVVVHGDTTGGTAHPHAVLYTPVQCPSVHVPTLPLHASVPARDAPWPTDNETDSLVSLHGAPNKGGNYALAGTSRLRGWLRGSQVTVTSTTKLYEVLCIVKCRLCTVLEGSRIHPSLPSAPIFTHTVQETAAQYPPVRICPRLLGLCVAIGDPFQLRFPPQKQSDHLTAFPLVFLVVVVRRAGTCD